MDSRLRICLDVLMVANGMAISDLDIDGTLANGA